MPLPLLIPAVAACCGSYLASMHESEHSQSDFDALPPSDYYSAPLRHHGGGDRSAGHEATSKLHKAYYRALLFSHHNDDASRTEFQRLPAIRGGDDAADVEASGAEHGGGNRNGTVARLAAGNKSLGGSLRSQFVSEASDRSLRRDQQSCNDVDPADKVNAVVTLAQSASGAEITSPLTGMLHAHIGYADGRFIDGKVLDLPTHAETWVLAFSPNSEILAVGLVDGQGVTLYETKYFQPIHTVECSGTISALKWRRFGKQEGILAIGSLDGTIKVVSMRTSQSSSFGTNADEQMVDIAVVVNSLCQFEMSTEVRCLSFIPTYEAGLALAVGETGGDVSILSNISPIAREACGKSSRNGSAASRKSTKYHKQNSCDSEETTRQSNASKPVLCRIDFHTGAVLSLAISHDCRLLASGWSDGSIRVHNLDIDALRNVTAEALRSEKHCDELDAAIPEHSRRRKDYSSMKDRLSFEGRKGLQRTEGSRSLLSNLQELKREGAVRSLAFSLDPRILIAGGYDKSVMMIDTNIWKIVREMKHDGTINSIAFDSSHKFLAVGSRDKCVTIYDTSTLHPLKTIQTSGWVTSLSWGSGPYERVLGVRCGEQLLSFYNIQSTHIVKQKLVTSAGDGSSLSWSLNGQFLARANGDSFVVSSSTTGFPAIATRRRKGTVRSVCFCLNNEMQHFLAVVGDDGFLAIYQMCRSFDKVFLELLRDIFVEEDLQVVAWSEDGKTLAVGGREKKVYLYNTPEFTRRCDPIEVEGRIWSIDFMPPKCIAKFGDKLSAVSMAVGTDDSVAILFDVQQCQRTLSILRPRTVRCVRYHPTLPFLAIGDNNRVVLIDLIGEQVAKEFNVGFRVNCIDFSHCGRFVALADDCFFTIRETMSFKPLQIIPTRGCGQTVAFERNGQYLALDNHMHDAIMLQLGSLLGIEFLPLECDLNDLPDWVVEEAVYRSDDGPSFLQRHMLEGAHSNIRCCAEILKRFPEAIYTNNRRTGEDCFTTALKTGKPVLIVVVMSTLVDGSLETENGKRSFLTTSVPEKGFAVLSEMVSYLPSKYIREILGKVTFVKAPFTEARIWTDKHDLVCASSAFTSPWGTKGKLQGKVRENIDHKSETVRIPALLPLPGLGSFEFLKTLTNECPPSVFDNDAMGLVLDIMWRKHVRHFFLADLALYIGMYILWIVFVDSTSSSTSRISDSWSDTTTVGFGVTLVVLNTVFAVKELIQSGWGLSSDHFRQIWNIADFLCIIFVYATTTMTMIQGTGRGSVTLGVLGSLVLTMKLLSYLRGFQDTGWLISVLRRNFHDARGFAVVMFFIVIGFTASFRLLFGDVQGQCNLGLDGAGQIVNNCNPDPYNSLLQSLLSTFELSIIGSYDPSILYQTQSTFLAPLLFVLAITVILVIALNALIALLSDSYSRVQESAQANQRRERAELIVEYMSLLPKRRLKSIEAKTRYFHAMLEADAAGDLLVNKDDWQGGLNALRRDINELNEIANEETRGLVNKVKGDLTNEILTLQSDMSTALEDIANQIREVRRMQTRMSGTILGAGVQGAGKQVTTAVNTVRMIGSKIPILGPGIEGIANLNFAGGKVLPSAQLLPNAPRGRSESPHRATANRSQNAL